MIAPMLEVFDSLYDMQYEVYTNTSAKVLNFILPQKQVKEAKKKELVINGASLFTKYILKYTLTADL